MISKRSSKTLLPFLVIAVGYALPALALLPFGSLWLWQHGYLLPWAAASAVFVSLAAFVQWRVLRAHQLKKSAPADVDGPVAAGQAADPTWSPVEQAAWADVLAAARRIDTDRLNSRDAVLQLGLDTVALVAKRIHPEAADPLWQFTVPEAFALLERVSRKLGRVTAESIPLSDRLTVAQALAAYRWRGALDVADRTYRIWRLIRLANPVAAATNELRERLSKQMLTAGRAHLVDRLANAYVSEVGRAAIDLYGGRLHPTATDLSASLTPVSEAAHADIALRPSEPLRILVAGQRGAGKSAFVNALTRQVQAPAGGQLPTSDFVAYDLKLEGLPEAHLVDTPSLATTDADVAIFLTKAAECDMLIWVVAAHRADREADRRLILAQREMYAKLTSRQSPPLIIVLTHVDLLKPLRDWSPPYAFDGDDRPKALAIRSAIEASASDFNVSPSAIVAVSLGVDPIYNMDAVEKRILQAAPLAQQAKLLRQRELAKSTWDWRKVVSQTAGAGRLIGRTLRP